jgi:hypothetical protein
MMLRPILLPTVAPLLPNCVEHSLQNLHVELTKLSVRAVQTDETVDAKEFWELFDCPSYVRNVKPTCWVTNLVASVYSIT